MGHAEPGAVRPPYWSTFPAAALSGVDWDDHEDSHRAVMRLFPKVLAGPSGERRATAGILYRLDDLDGARTVLVQSDVPPELLPAQARTMTVPEQAWSLPSGARVQFRVAVNPERRRDRDRGYLIPPDEVPAWLEQRTQDTLEDLEVLVSVRRMTRAGRRRRVLTVETIDAVATVKDGAAFEHLRRSGVGRAKSFGAGLLTARRIAG